MEKVKKTAKILLCIGIALMLISMITVSVIQTDSGKVTVKELFVETDDGFGQSSLLFIPSTATPDHPAPAIVTSHGLFNNKEMQDANFVELARRGYVVLAIDQANHGVSDMGGTNGIATTYNNGVYEGAVILSRLPYVDVTRIGITGHSMGGMSCNVAIGVETEKGTHLISAVLLNCADAVYTDGPAPAPGAPATGDFANIYGSRDVGILSATYDEFFHGSVDANGVPQASPYFMNTANAQSFLNFGKDPAGLETRDADTFYHETVDGKDTVRVIYRNPIIHPWSHFSTQATHDTIEFFDKTIGAPNPIAPNNQIWPAKEALNFVGLVGFVLFLMAFAVLMLYTPFFSSLRAKEVVPPLQANTGGKLWFWGSLVAGALFSMLVYLPIANPLGMGAAVRQSEVYAISLWAAVCGAFVLVVMTLFYFLHAKKHGVTLEDRGIKISMPNLGKTLLLAVIVVSVTYAWVFLADYFFKADFRIWTLAFKAFNKELLLASLFPYLPLLLVFFVATSMANNCFNYNQVGGKHGWVNTLIVSLFAGAPAILMLAIQYITYYSTDHMFWSASAAGVQPMFIVWLFPLIVVLPAAVAISRWIYKATKNPYLAGIINALMITLFACMNTRTML